MKKLLIIPVLLIFTLTACAGSPATRTGKSPTPHSSATANANTSGNSPIGVEPTPGLNPAIQACPAAVSSPAYWDPVVGTQSGVSQVESVICASLLGKPSLQALVKVRYQGTGSVLDVYVYNDIVGARPTQLFKLQGLYKGDAKISAYNTILTAEVDQASRLNSNRSNAALIQDLFREFAWSQGTVTFVQVSFPGIFPDLTRFQAEADQGQVNQGHQPWKLNAVQTAQALAATLLSWPAASPATIISGGGAHDVNAVVTLKSPGPGNGSISMTLGRLEGNTNGGIWEVTAVQAGTMASITAPISRDLLRSPATVTGTGTASGGRIGTVAILDHLYTGIGHAEARGATGNGAATFSTIVTYHSTFQGGAEEGLVALYVYSTAGSAIVTAVMEKELLEE